MSLTKNGYLKIAAIVAAYDSHEMLNHCRDSIRGVNLERSQVANILGADPHTGTVPAFWDEVRGHDRTTIRAFTFLAVVFSAEQLIRAFRDADRGTPTGVLLRSEMAEKQYTNLQFAMAQVGLCDYARGTDQISYDMAPLTRQLRSVGHLVGQLLRAKL
ncbi:MAG: hypothetical protein KJ749_10865, partial [Planctomycetes bacterium]|nr:hypothetical protein [Planctomycetota bacterium]